MKEQRAVISETKLNFQEELDNFFREGWQIVPNTITISHQPCGSKNIYVQERYVAIVERDLTSIS